MSPCKRMTETFAYIEKLVTYAVTFTLRLNLIRFAVQNSKNFVSDSSVDCELTGTFGVINGLQTSPNSGI